MARRLMLASVAAASITAAARPARADDDGPYRGTMAIVDVASVAVVASAIAGESAPGVMVGLAAYGLGSPVVHAAHGRWGAAGLALGARVGLPAVGILIGCGAARSGNRGGTTRGGLGDAVGCAFGGALGGAAGVIAAVVIDYAVLAAVDDTTTPVMLRYGVAF